MASKLPKPKKVGRTPWLSYLCVGILSVVLTFVLIARKESAIASAPAPAPIVVNEDDIVFVPTPIRAIASGEQLEAGTFVMTKWPKSRLSGEYAASIEELQNAVALTPLPKLLPVPVSALTRDDVSMNAVVDGIPEGMRAITVKADAEIAVEGWARPGNSVDVILIAQTKDAEQGLEAKVIAENVRILSAGRVTHSAVTNTAPEAPKTVTLLTTQEDALKIKAAATLGKLTFSLRGAADKTPSKVLSVAQRAILSGSRIAAPLPVEPRKGFARDADGREFILTGDARWVPNETKLSSLQNTAAQNTEPAR